MSIEKLKRIFPDDYLRIVNLANGVCHEPVVQRIMPKSLGVTKKLYNTNGDQILIWTKGLATELVRRLETDQDKVRVLNNAVIQCYIICSFLELLNISNSVLVWLVKFALTFMARSIFCSTIWIQSLNMSRNSLSSTTGQRMKANGKIIFKHLI